MGGVGRPEVGPAFTVRFPAEMVGSIDEAAARDSMSRAGWLRWAAEEQLVYPRETLAALVAWMLQEGWDDVVYALEKPWKHRDVIFCAQHGISGEQLDRMLERRRRVEELGWRVEGSGPVDYRVCCPHSVVVEDSEADRAGQPTGGCLHGCTVGSSLEGSAAQEAVVVPLRRRRRR